MSTPDPDGEFTRRSDTESVCMYCFITVRVNAGESLNLAELLHAMECAFMPDGARLSIRRRQL